MRNRGGADLEMAAEAAGLAPEQRRFIDTPYAWEWKWAADGNDLSEEWRMGREVLVELAPECDDYDAFRVKLADVQARLVDEGRLDDKVRVGATREAARARVRLLLGELWRDAMDEALARPSRAPTKTTRPGDSARKGGRG